MQRSDLSAAASTKVRSAFAWSTVRTVCTIEPTGCVSRSDRFSSRSSGESLPAEPAAGRPSAASASSPSAGTPLETGVMAAACDEMGRMLSSSSSTYE